MITDKEWEQYLGKYGGLINTIAKKISGDNMLASHEDNCSDLKIAALKSIQGFNRKTGETFEQMMQNPLFDKYTKTVLWHLKNSKGVKLTKRMSFINKMLPMHYTHDGEDYVNEFADVSSAGDPSKEMLSLFDTTSNDMDLIISLIASDPSVLNDSGKLKIAAVQEKTGLTIHATRRAIASIEKRLNKVYRNE